MYFAYKEYDYQRYEKKPAIVEDETGLGIPESDLLRRGEKVRILHHQPRDFTTEARFSEKDFEVCISISPSFLTFNNNADLKDHK